jgi:ribosomal-protein-alanine N-acetyltransferase
VKLGRKRDAVGELAGPRVRLRPLVGDDFDQWARIRAHSRDWLEPWEPALEPGAADPSRDAGAFKARCASWDRQRQFDSAYGYGLFVREVELVGEVSLGSVQRGPFQSAFLGYWIDREHAGRDLVPEGVALLLRFAFGDLALHRVEAAIVPRNEASRRVAEKLMFREEGLAERFLQINGVWEDHVRYGMTLEDWERHREAITERFLESE